MVFVTNLRLPGQYDERLLGSLGLQGPYYNWNRWYLPSIGRYLELDPLALEGELNGVFYPDWYGYALGNPISFFDPLGLSAQLCWRGVQNAGWTGAQHCYMQFNNDTSDTLSYWAKKVVDKSPNVTPDLDPNNSGHHCQGIPPRDEKYNNDRCLRDAMRQSASFIYNIKTFNCCDCVARAVEICGSPHGVWPDEPLPGFGPPRPRSPKPIPKKRSSCGDHC